jgi:hypothetical protein
MKINRKDLKELYRDYLEDNPPVSRAKCPSPQDITACIRGKGSKKTRAQIIDHIFQCGYCREEFHFILETIREEKNFIHDLSTIIQERGLRKKDKINPLFPLRLSWLYSLILMIGLVMITFLVKNISEERKYRGGNSQLLMLISPKKNTSLGKQLKFEWRPVQKSDYYILEIFDEALYPIWNSDKITVNHTLLPEKITNTLKEQKTHYWMVTAFLSDGKTIESRLQKFTISD